METLGVNDVLAQMKILKAKAQGATPVEPPVTQDFSSTFKQAINQVNEAQTTSGQLQDSFIKGDTSVSMAEVLVAQQKSAVSFQALLQVRNKFIQAYKDIMNMPI